MLSENGTVDRRCEKFEEQLSNPFCTMYAHPKADGYYSKGIRIVEECYCQTDHCNWAIKLEMMIKLCNGETKAETTVKTDLCNGAPKAEMITASAIIIFATVAKYVFA